MLPASATLPRYPANHTQTHNPEQHTHTLAAQMAVWPAGCFTQQATHARTAHHRAAATSLITLQRSAPSFPRVSSPCTAPAHLPALCCAVAQPCMPWRASTRVALAHKHMNEHTSTYRAFGIGLRGLETRDDPQRSAQRTTPPPPAKPPLCTQSSREPCTPPLQSTAKPRTSPIPSTTPRVDKVSDETRTRFATLLTISSHDHSFMLTQAFTDAVDAAERKEDAERSEGSNTIHPAPARTAPPRRRGGGLRPPVRGRGAGRTQQPTARTAFGPPPVRGGGAPGPP